MKPGEIIITTHITQITPGISFVYKAEKGDEFVFIFLGSQSRDGSKPLNPVKRLEEMGWTPPPDLLLAETEDDLL